MGGWVWNVRLMLSKANWAGAESELDKRSSIAKLILLLNFILV